MFYLASYKYGLKRQYVDRHGKRVRKRLRLEKAPWFFSMLEPEAAERIKNYESVSSYRVGQNVRVHGLIRSLTLMYMHHAHLVFTITIPLKGPRRSTCWEMC